MDKESLFQSIKKEEVIIWAGAGFSRYAGYPMGGELAKTLYDTLVASERKQVDENSSLPKLADDYIALKKGNRSAITSELIKAFKKNPRSTQFHDLLAKLPHFKNIITTNYDTLFERAYGERAHPIVKGNHIAIGNKDSVNIFKIHGDLLFPESIIISDYDYRKFFNTQEDSLLWTVVKGLAANNVILFLGYGFEDPNIVAMFERIQDQLGDFTKGAYLVAPGIDELKKYKLESKGIIYIDSTGEEFIQELYDSIKKTIVFDTNDNNTCIDTAGKYLDGLGFKPILEAENGRFKIANLVGKDNRSVNYSVKFNIKNNESLVKKVRSITSGETIGRIELTYSDFSSLLFEIEGIHMPLDKDGKYVIASHPVRKGNFDVLFEECDHEFTDLHGSAFRSKNEYRFEVKYKSFDFTVTTIRDLPNAKKYTISYENNTVFKNTSEALAIEEFIKHVRLGGKVKLLFENESSFYGNLGKIPKLAKESHAYIRYINLLKLVEKTFNLRFSNFTYKDECSDSQTLADILNQVENRRKWTETIKVNLSDDTKRLHELVGKRNESQIIINEQVSRNFDMHGKTITVKYSSLVAILNPIVKYITKDQAFYVSSRTNKIIEKYVYPQTDFLETERNLDI
ncbi:SIR2 family NAD-dependent protein deacylase [Hymenobacter canadensis]|uniref:SIR2 family protein n=1 Tax=Hymenobacter canadensis TaxID=2999067 RepID=A0ABY7LTK3_9BACT|nr:SIR2 family protein [Hymenobacter canadensis]WBA43184.1 SIR2 family protein [Hymenobacter canadensis]